MGMLRGSGWGTKRICYTECFFKPFDFKWVDSKDNATELSHTKLGVYYMGSSSQCLFRCETNNN